MPVKTLRANNLTWHNIFDVNQDDVAFLRANFNFHALDLKDVMGDVQRSKIDSYRNYLFIILQSPSERRTNEQVRTDLLFVFVGKNFLITITPSRSKVLNSLYYRVVNNQRFREETFTGEGGYLLYKVLDTFLHSVWSRPYQIDRAIQRVENDIDAGKGKRLVFDIASLRRRVLHFKAIIGSQRIVVNTLTQSVAAFLGKNLSAYFDDIDDYIEKVAVELDGYHDRILSLHEINESLISYRTTKVMSILTIFSVALLPLTLLSGIFGMNIPLPFSNHPGFVWAVFGALTVIIVGIFLVLKKKDWI